MSYLFAGTIYGHPCVKVTRNNADLPWEVPNSDYGKFVFNSDHEHAYVQHIRSVTFDGYAYDGVEKFYYLDGTGPSNSLFRVFAYYPSNAAARGKWLQILLDNAGLGYVPLAELRTMAADGRMIGPSYSWHETWPGQLGIYQSFPSYRAGAAPTVLNQGGYVGMLTEGLAMTVSGQKMIAAVWDLPADSTPLPSNGTVVPGQEMARFTNLHAQVARPGYDVRTAIGRQFILNSDRVPAKIIQAAETVVPAGQAVEIPISSPFPLTEEMYVDFILANVGEQLCHPAMSFFGDYGTREFGFDYRLLTSPNRLVLYNTKNRDIVVRWMLLADSSAGQTTGGSQIVYNGNDGIQDFVQIKVPGSSDVAPSMKDVLLDTRLPTLRIVDEGYLPHTVFNEAPVAIGYGEACKTISFVNTGFSPFVKFVGVAGNGNIIQPSMTNFRINTAAIDGGVWHGRASCFSICALVSTGSIKFHHSRDNPSGLVVTPGAPRPFAEARYPAQEAQKLVGIRYYIFALPN